MSKPKTLEKYQDMSLRDYFAGMALQHLNALHYTAEKAAKEAYKYADAMLTEREKNETQ